jgi:hypothetical protein
MITHKLNDQMSLLFLLSFIQDILNLDTFSSQNNIFTCLIA